MNSSTAIRELPAGLVLRIKRKGSFGPLKNVWNTEFKGFIWILWVQFKGYISILRGPITKISSPDWVMIWFVNQIILINVTYMFNIRLLTLSRLLQHIYLLHLGCYNVLLGYYDVLLQHKRNIVNDFALNILLWAITCASSRTHKNKLK